MRRRSIGPGDELAHLLAGRGALDVDLEGDVGEPRVGVALLIQVLAAPVEGTLYLRASAVAGHVAQHGGAASQGHMAEAEACQECVGRADAHAEAGALGTLVANKLDVADAGLA